MTNNYNYGAKRSLPDFRNFKLAVAHTPTTLPPKVDLSPAINSIYDQGGESSCTGNAAASLSKFIWKKDMNKDVNPSRNFIYWNERNLENTVSSDGGAEVADALKVLNQIGFCDEASWGYATNTIFAMPPKACFTAALDFRIQTYQEIPQDHLDICSNLASGYPFIFGFSVFDAFEGGDVARTGVVPMPQANDSMRGGHCTMGVGYDDSKQLYKILNSWGPNWGDHGYFYLPYAYLENKLLSFDFWTIR